MILRILSRMVAAITLFTASWTYARTSKSARSEPTDNRVALVRQLVSSGVCDEENAYLIVQDIHDEASVLALLKLLQDHQFEQTATNEIWRTK
ncbi:MAG: hypothetical protein HC902_10180 [Calothrix sp. SM1_5_4]|nr:hypothetical protein [Calothrix sp. SM1_5_4]